MDKARQLPTLDQPVPYEIRVPGQIGAGWVQEITVTIEGEGSGSPITVIAGAFDQAALQGLLRRLYSLGLPLISLICLEDPSKGDGRE